MCKIEIMAEAWQDLKNIDAWYASAFGRESADKVVGALLHTIERLEEHPDSGSDTPSEKLNMQGYRMVISKRLVAIYKHIGDMVFVYHIADTRRSYGKLFEIK